MSATRSVFHLNDQTLSLVVRRVVKRGGETDDSPRGGRRRLDGEEDDDVCEAGDEGHAPDESDQSVGPLHGAHLDVVKRPADSDVTLHCHASQVQRTVPVQHKHTPYGFVHMI